MDQPFVPTGPTYFVTNAVVQVGFRGRGASFRIRNLNTSVQYISWGVDSTVTSKSAPTAGAPVSKTLGLLATSVETFGIADGDVFMIASAATGFEVTQGTGV